MKLAAQQCRYFAEEMVPALDKVLNECRAQGVTFLGVYQNKQPPAFILNDGKFIQNSFDMALIKTEMPTAAKSVVPYLNTAESFAIPFAAGVADDETGFQETAAIFCAGINLCMPAIFFLCQTQGVSYPSVLKLFSIWNDRRAAQAIAPALKSAQAWVEEVDKKRIKRI